MAFLDYIGTGSEYPWKVENGSGKILTGRDLINASIVQILGTDKGKLPWNPYFGSNLFRLLFEPIDAIVISLGTTYIVEALKQWERRIKITEIIGENRIETSNYNGLPAKKAVTLFSIRYQIIGTNQTGNFVYPFYRELEY